MPKKNEKDKIECIYGKECKCYKAGLAEKEKDKQIGKLKEDLKYVRKRLIEANEWCEIHVKRIGKLEKKLALKEKELEEEEKLVHVNQCLTRTYKKENESLKKRVNDSFTKKQIEEMLWLPCCHCSGMHDPGHFENREGICDMQISTTFLRFCKEININPKTKSDPNCGWCIDYPDKKKGEGLKLFNAKNIKERFKKEFEGQ